METFHKFNSLLLIYVNEQRMTKNTQFCANVGLAIHGGKVASKTTKWRKEAKFDTFS